MGKQQWRAADYVRNGAFVARLGEPLIDLLAPVAGERILDLGCGDGTLTARIAESGARVLGLDASESMVTAARTKGVEAVCCAADAMAFSGAFDAVFSNAALHWMKNAREVADRVREALRPGGRFVAEFGGEGNVAAVHRALARALACHPAAAEFEDPWYFPSVATHRAVLESAGFEVVFIERFERPTPLPAGLDDWLRLFADHALGGLPDRVADDVVAGVEADVRDALWAPEQGWVMDYVRLRFEARRPV